MKIDSLLTEINQQIAKILKVDEKFINAEQANEKFDADIAVPLFKASKELSNNPPLLAKQLLESFSHKMIKSVELVGGFLNLTIDSGKLANEVLSYDLDFANSNNRENQTILVEFNDPNPFKEFHIGHLYDSVIGEAISNLFELSGAKVHRLSYHGDVGMHIAKSVWGIKKTMPDEGLNSIDEEKRASYLGQAYSIGARAYEDNENAKNEIEEINKKIYTLEDEEINHIYKIGREWSFNYFSEISRLIGTSSEKRYFESETGPRGVELVSSLVGEVFEESDGAIIFRGEEHGLHTRVFINSAGLPTYEAKDLALVHMKNEDYPEATKSIVITANEQSQYFKVMLKALEQFAPKLAEQTVHISHGEVVLPSGKMSSRTGDVTSALDLIENVKENVSKVNSYKEGVDEVALGAIKYAFLKQNIGANVVYDVNESISLEGQTGPYVQYAAVRIKSILNKINASDEVDKDYDYSAEHELLKRVYFYPLALERATDDLSPQIVAQYIYGLARELNKYYENVNIKNSEPGVKEARMKVLEAVHLVFASSARVMGISLPPAM